MQYLLDTGILLRLVNPQAAEHSEIRHAVQELKRLGHSAVCTFQNRAEFWNVCTRPVTARGGLGNADDFARYEGITSVAPAALGP